MANVVQNLAEIRERIRESAFRVNRDPAEITLIAVTKYVDVSRIEEAIAAGVTHIAENRVQEGVRKFPLLSGNVVKHLIGTLQTNKVKAALEHFDLIHSVDRLGLVAELAKQADKLQKQVKFLIQLNISGEATKHGLSPDELPGFMENLKAYPRLIPCGLMTMAPLSDEPEMARPVFRRLRELFDEIAETGDFSQWRYLSMGMSQDYPIAVEEGANLLRIGSAVFK